MTTQTETATAQPVAYHWIATVEVSGRIVTSDGPIDAIPGVHTHTSTYRAVLANLTARYGANFGLLYFSLTPDQL